jgi:hypothetical protein
MAKDLCVYTISVLACYVRLLWTDFLGILVQAAGFLGLFIFLVIKLDKKPASVLSVFNE